MKRNNKKGFTLAELLIVVAIIAVLTAIAIPVFSTQLEKSREGTDLANIRSIYAEAALVAVNGKEVTNADNQKSAITGGSITASVSNAGVWTVNVAGFKANQQTAGWVIDVSNVAGADIKDYQPTKESTGAGQAIVFTIDATGKLTNVAAS